MYILNKNLSDFEYPDFLNNYAFEFCSRFLPEIDMNNYNIFMFINFGKIDIFTQKLL